MSTRTEHRRHFAGLLTVFTAACLVAASLLTAAPPNPPYKDWVADNDPEWKSLTNHLTWCYNALVERYKAVGIDTNSVHKPSFVYPFSDYTALAGDADFISAYYVCHTNANSSGKFDEWFKTHRRWDMWWLVGPDSRSFNGGPWVWDNVTFTNTPFPTYTNYSFHAAAGFTNWATNVICHSWSITTNREIVTQVEDAIQQLKWTFLVAPYSNNVSRWSQSNYVYQTRVNLDNPSSPYTGGPDADQPVPLSEHDDVHVNFSNPVVSSNDYAFGVYGQLGWQVRAFEHHGSAEVQWFRNYSETTYPGERIKFDDYAMSQEAVQSDYRAVVSGIPTGMTADVCMYSRFRTYPFTLPYCSRYLFDTYLGEPRSTNHAAGVLDYNSSYYAAVSNLLLWGGWNAVCPAGRNSVFGSPMYANGLVALPRDTGLPAVYTNGYFTENGTTTVSPTGSIVTLSPGYTITLPATVNTSFSLSSSTNLAFVVGDWPFPPPWPYPSYQWFFSFSGESEISCIPGYGINGGNGTGTGSGEAGFRNQEGALILLKWQFTNETPPSTPVAAAVNWDTDLDWLCEVPADLASLGVDHGTAGFAPDVPGAIVTLPVAGMPAWYPNQQPHGYLLERRMLPYQYLVPGMNDRDGYFFSYSLNTRILESGSNAVLGVKHASILRPNGAVVLFEFAIGGELGVPVTPNHVWRSYVLHDLTPANNNDRRYALHFTSGIIHEFDDNGLLCAVSNVNGVAVSAASTGMTIGTSTVATVTFDADGYISASTNGRYKVEMSWANDRPSEIKYTAGSTEKCVPGYSAGAGNVTSLTKTYFTDATVSSISDSSIQFGSGASRSRTVSGVSVTIGSSSPSCGNYSIEYKTNTAQRIVERTINANGGTATTTWQWKSGTQQDRYSTNRLLKCALLYKVTDPDNLTVTFDYDSDTGWLTSREFAVGNGHNRRIEFAYTTTYEGDTAVTNRLVERPHTVTEKYGSSTIGRTLFAYQGAATAEAQSCRTSTAAWDNATNLVVINSYWNGLLAHRTHPAGWFLSVNAIGGTNGQLAQTSWTHSGQTNTTLISGFGLTLHSTNEEAGVVLDSTVITATNFGRAASIAFLDGSAKTNHYKASGVSKGLFGPERITEMDSSDTTLTYYDTGWLQAENRTDTGINYSYEYDPLGNVKKRTETGGSDSVSVTADYDARSRPKTATDLLGTTSFSYDVISGVGTKTTVTPPGLGQRIEERYQDGSLKKIEGAGVVGATYYTYVPVTDGLKVEDHREDGPQVDTTCNMLDLPARIKNAGVSGEYVYDYDLAGRLHKETDEDSITRITTYNQKGEMDAHGTQVDGSSGLDPASSDRYSKYERSVAAGAVSHKTSQFPQRNSDATVTRHSSSAAPNGMSGSSSFAGRTSTWERTTAFTSPGKYQTQDEFSDGTRTDSQYKNWRLETTKRYDANNVLLEQVEYKYDGLGALERTISSMHGTTQYVLDTKRRLYKIIAPKPADNRTYSYRTGTALTASDSRSDGTAITYDYYDNGLLKRQYDIGTYDLQYQYDKQGRRTSLRTFQNGQARMTTWQYDSTTGRLKKKFLDGLAVPAEEYTYHDNGRVDTIKDANLVETTLNYDTATGDLTGTTTTAPDTPATTVAYDRMGLPTNTAVAGGIGESQTFADDDQVATVTVSGAGQVPDIATTRGYAAIHPGLTNFALSCTGITNLDQALAVTYDAAARVASMTSGTFVAAFAYGSYGAITTVTNTVAGTVAIVRTFAWDSSDMRLTNIAYSVDGVVTASYAIVYPPNKTRIGRIDLADGTYWEYGYDDKGHLLSAKRFSSDGTTFLGQQFAYQYDEIGNRTAGGRVDVSGNPIWSFQADSRNHHVTRNWGNTVDVAGSAVTNATVTVQAQSSQRQGVRFLASVTVDNAASAVDTSLVVRAVQMGPSFDLVAVATNRQYVPQATETVSYTDKGEIRDDSRYDYKFDAYGQMVSVTSKLTAPRYKLAFTYYQNGRRATKTVSREEGGAWVQKRKSQFLYDLWNLVGEVRTEGCQTNVINYTWGPDLAGWRNGQLGQTAGGIGGLLSITIHSDGVTRTLLPIVDQVGTVHHILDAASRQIVASFEYDPFGVVLSQTGDKGVIENVPFRFQSKYYDHEVGFCYYGYRYYDPLTGTWHSPDPLGERGGANLFLAFGGDPVNKVDPLGLYLVAFDGTGNNKDAKGNSPTNVERLWRSYTKGRYYIRGVGSSDTIIWSALENSSGGLTGAGGNARIEEAWEAVVEHYKGMTDEEIAADPLDIVGFSRGAALARAFANVVKQRCDPRKYGWVHEWFGKNAMLESRINIEGDALPIRFLGVYDTVPSFGKPGNHVDIGYNFTIPDNVANVRHAISRDEDRSLFPLANIATNTTRIEQMFPGVHSDVGGGYADNLDIQFGPLKWMWEEGVKCGVSWDMPTELKGWTQPSGILKGHQSNVPVLKKFLWVIPYGMAEHPTADWGPVLPTDKQLRPVWTP